MINERPVEDPRLQAALNEIRHIMERFDFPGSVMLVSAEEAVFSYKMDATWSALRKDRSLPLGFRFRAISADTGKRETERRVEGAMHTICQLSDYGEQTTAWMEDLKLMLRRAGIEFDHTPFGGRPLPHLTFGNQLPASSQSNSKPSPPKPPIKVEVVDDPLDELTKGLTDGGLLIEAGFISLRRMAIPADASAEQIADMRMAFFAGAQHVFASIMRMLEPDAEPTENDMRRMNAIDQELTGFITEFKAKHGGAL